MRAVGPHTYFLVRMLFLRLGPEAAQAPDLGARFRELLKTRAASPAKPKITSGWAQKNAGSKLRKPLLLRLLQPPLGLSFWGSRPGEALRIGEVKAESQTQHPRDRQATHGSEAAVSGRELRDVDTRVHPCPTQEHQNTLPPPLACHSHHPVIQSVLIQQLYAGDPVKREQSRNWQPSPTFIEHLLCSNIH